MKNSIRITAQEKQQITQAITDAQNRAHLHENGDGRIRRKAREYTQRYNAMTGVTCENGVGGNTRRPVYSRRTPRQHEKCEVAKRTHTETCVLYQDGYATVVNATITETTTTPLDGITQRHITLRTPQHNATISVRKMRRFTELARTITMQEQRYTVDELAEAILRTGKNIYIVE